MTVFCMLDILGSAILLLANLFLNQIGCGIFKHLKRGVLAFLPLSSTAGLVIKQFFLYIKIKMHNATHVTIINSCLREF